MKNRNYKESLNVFTYGSCSWRRPIEKIKWFFRRILFAWQRAVLGYCDYDLWDLDSFYQQLLIDSLSTFRTRTFSHPNDLTSEGWNAVLKQIIRDLQEGIHNSHDNIWEELYFDELNRRRQIKIQEDGSVAVFYNDEDEDFNDVKSRYHKEDKRLRELEDKKRMHGLAILAKYWNDLWY